MRFSDALASDGRNISRELRRTASTMVSPSGNFSMRRAILSSWRVDSVTLVAPRALSPPARMSTATSNSRRSLGSSRPGHSVLMSWSSSARGRGATVWMSNMDTSSSLIHVFPSCMASPTATMRNDGWIGTIAAASISASVLP